jgi:hypothetical protein
VIPNLHCNTVDQSLRRLANHAVQLVAGRLAIFAGENQLF